MSKKRGMGTWYLRGKIYWIKYHKDGKPFRESSFSTKESDAKELLKSRVSEISQGTFMGLDYKRLTFDDLGQEFLSDYQINQRKSYWRAEISLNHLRGFFGGMKACAIDTPLIRKYIKERQAAEAKNATINRELAALRRMFRLAMQDGKMPRVPYFPMLEENNVRSGFLEQEQYDKLKMALPDYLKPILIMAFWTGCRKSEILGLKWSQVDFLNKQIVLEARTTKNNEPRTIPMSEELYQAILAQRAVTSASGESREFVFTNHGRRIRFFYDAWKTATKRAGCPGLLLHDCRRSAVRNFVRAGVADKVARAISGHKTRSVFDRYNIVDEKDLRDATTKLENHLKNGLGTVWAQNQHLQPQPSQLGTVNVAEGKALTH
jgi:integrase